MNINEIDEKNYLVRVTVALEFVWEDSRIRVNDSSSFDTPVTVDYAFVEKIWICCMEKNLIMFKKDWKTFSVFSRYRYSSIISCLV